MKSTRRIMSTFLIASSLVAAPATIFAESPNLLAIEAKDSLISPLAVIGTGSFSYPGQGNITFPFTGGSTSETVRVYIQNTGSKPFNYRVISPQGYVWVASTSLSSGSSSTRDLTLNSSNSGNWIIETWSNDGSTYSGSYNVRDKLPL